MFSNSKHFWGMKIRKYYSINEVIGMMELVLKRAVMAFTTMNTLSNIHATVVTTRESTL